MAEPKWNSPEDTQQLTLFPCLKSTKYKRLKVDQWLPGARTGGRGLTAKGHPETFLSDGNIFYLDCGGGYMTACFCQNS